LEHDPHIGVPKTQLQAAQLKAQAFAKRDGTIAGAQLQFEAAAGERKEGGTCSDGEDGEGEAWVGRERVEPRRGGVHRRLVVAEGGGEEPPQLVAGQGGGVGLDVHGGRTLGYFAPFLSTFFRPSATGAASGGKEEEVLRGRVWREMEMLVAKREQ
jgi:hypothetical protein